MGSVRVRGVQCCATIAALVIATAVTTADPQSADARRSRKRKALVPATVSEVVTPLGLQGSDGAGVSVVIPFRLLDASRTPADVEVEFGVDGANGALPDGMIAPDEYLPATEDRLDPRNTRANRKPQVLTTGAGPGAAHAFVWRSDFDLGIGRWLREEFAMTPQGRYIPDPDHPGANLYSVGSPGVVVRVRAVAGSGRRRVVGAWVASESFDLDNTLTPRFRIEDVSAGATTPSGSDVAGAFSIRWHAQQPDSEDLNGDGVVRPELGEDVNGDGKGRLYAVGVHFDYHVLADGEDARRMSPGELDRLSWQPCTHHATAGDTDALPGFWEWERVGGRPTASAIGNSWIFVWDAAADVPPGGAERIVLRGRCVDTMLKRSEPAYWLQPIPR